MTRLTMPRDPIPCADAVTNSGAVGTPPDLSALPPRTVFLLGARGVAWAILRAALARIPAARVIGQSDTFADAMTRIPDEQPDVVISAPALANRSALPVLRALHAACPATTLVVYAATLDAGTLHAYARAGVTGYLGWQLDHTTFQHSLAALLAGPVVVGSFALTELLVGVPSLPAAPPLSERERLVLNRLAEGLTRAQIARAERLSLRTVERTTADLMTKLAAPSPVALGVKAAQLGLVPPLQDEAAPAEGAESDGGGDQAMAERRQAGYCSRGSRSGGVPLHHSA